MLIAYTKLEDPLAIEIHIHLSMYMLRSILVIIYNAWNIGTCI